MRTHGGIGFRLRASVVAFAATVAATRDSGAQAIAPPPPPLIDVLQTTDGTALRGRVLEIRLYQDVTIQLEDGSVRVVPWSVLASGSADLESLRTASNWRLDAGFPRPFALLAAGGFSVDDPLEPGPGRVPLAVDSDGAAQHIGLQTAGAPSTDQTGVLCTTPCTLYVRPGTVPLVTIGSDEHARVHPVDVSSRGTRVVLHAGSTTSRAFGIAMVPIGAVGVLAGMMLSTSPASTAVAGIDAGGLLVIGGVAMVIGGAVMIRGAREGVRSVEALDSGMGFRF